MRMKVNQSRSFLPRPVQPAKISSLGADQKDLSLSERDWNLPLYTAISRKVVGKNVPATIPKGNMGYDQYIVPDDCSCRIYLWCFPLAHANRMSMSSSAIPSNFFEEKWTQNHPQCLLGLSRAHFFRQPFSKDVYSSFEKSCRKNCARDNPER